MRRLSCPAPEIVSLVPGTWSPVPVLSDSKALARRRVTELSSLPGRCTEADKQKMIQVTTTKNLVRIKAGAQATCETEQVAA